MARLAIQAIEASIQHQNAPRSTARSAASKSKPAEWPDVFHLLDLLEKQRVDYVLIGGFALAFNGIVRQTGDVDILVANTPSNNERWIAALSKLPDGAAAELVSVSSDPFSFDDDDGDDEPGVIRVIDAFVVDVLPKACGLTIDDLRVHIRRLRHGNGFINVLDLHGLRLTKQGVRGKDKVDLLSIEAALSALRHEVSEHVATMSRRVFEAEKKPPGNRIVFRADAELTEEERRDLAKRVIARAENDGDSGGINLEDLLIYCKNDTLISLIKQAETLIDLRGSLKDHDINLPEP